MNRILTYTQAIREALDQSMERDKSVFVIGLGVSYPNGADGTTKGLAEKYPGRALDMPCSESSGTGLCLGAALTGMRPVIVHGRVEFSLFAFDQIVTQAAKWNYMFGGGSPLPLVIRVAVGRQWGNGPQHTQALHSVFGHIPGLKVVIPSTPRSAKGLLNASIVDNNPVIFMEHRWLYGVSEYVPEEYYTEPLSLCKIVEQGKDITIVANSDTLLDAMRCSQVLREHGIEPEIIDLVSVNPVDYETILGSVKKTRRLLVADVGNKAYGIGSEIVSAVCEQMFDELLSPPLNIGAPQCPCPTSPSLTENYYPNAQTLVQHISRMFKVDIRYEVKMDFLQLHLPQEGQIETLVGEGTVNYQKG